MRWLRNIKVGLIFLNLKLRFSFLKQVFFAQKFKFFFHKSDALWRWKRNKTQTNYEKKFRTNKSATSLMSINLDCDQLILISFFLNYFNTVNRTIIIYNGIEIRCITYHLCFQNLQKRAPKMIYLVHRQKTMQLISGLQFRPHLNQSPL